MRGQVSLSELIPSDLLVCIRVCLDPMALTNGQEHREIGSLLPTSNGRSHSQKSLKITHVPPFLLA